MPTQETHDKVTEQIAKYMYEQKAARKGYVSEWTEVHKDTRAVWLQYAKDARDAVAYALLSGTREPR